MAEAAQAQGLEMDAGLLAEFAALENPLGPLQNRPGPPGLIDRLMRRKILHRKGHLEVPDQLSGGVKRVPIGPQYVWDISAPARQRWQGDPAYRPPGLAAFAGDFNELEQEGEPEGPPAL